MWMLIVLSILIFVLIKRKYRVVYLQWMGITFSFLFLSYIGFHAEEVFAFLGILLFWMIILTIGLFAMCLITRFMKMV